VRVREGTPPVRKERDSTEPFHIKGCAPTDKCHEDTKTYAFPTGSFPNPLNSSTHPQARVFNPHPQGLLTTSTLQQFLNVDRGTALRLIFSGLPLGLAGMMKLAKLMDWDEATVGDRISFGEVGRVVQFTFSF